MPTFFNNDAIFDCDIIIATKTGKSGIFLVISEPLFTILKAELKFFLYVIFLAEEVILRLFLIPTTLDEHCSRQILAQSQLAAYIHTA